jgi:WS/DGAT C-terminal domain
VDLPLEQDDPVERLVAVARETRDSKQRHDAQTLDVFFRDLSHLSRSLERHAEHRATCPRVFTLKVSNVPGPSGPQLVLGVVGDLPVTSRSDVSSAASVNVPPTSTPRITQGTLWDRRPAAPRRRIPATS